MRNFILLSFIFIVVGLSACSKGQTPTPTKFITNDSTLLFTFVKDSLYVDTYESGCGIECYRIEIDTETRSETLYKAYEFVLGDDEYFLLGDNRLHSSDSRMFGVFQKEDILSKHVYIWYPFSEMRVVK